jgi:hypothetical protein
MPLVRMTKIDIAMSQLNVAMTFYLEDRELVSAITLAGAAEEILGKLCEHQGKQSSLSRHAESARDLHLHLKGLFPDVFRHDPGTKPFVNFRNETRNELKHLISGSPIEADLLAKAGHLIADAIRNYVSLAGHETPTMRRFQAKRLHLLPPHDPSFDAPNAIP